MRNFEVMFILKPEEDKVINPIIDKYDELITKNGGKIEHIDKWGVKRLAYTIENLDTGYYVLITFSASNPCVKELDRIMKISDDVLRHMIISKEQKEVMHYEA